MVISECNWWHCKVDTHTVGHWWHSANHCRGVLANQMHSISHLAHIYIVCLFIFFIYQKNHVQSEMVRCVDDFMRVFVWVCVMFWDVRSFCDFIVFFFSLSPSLLCSKHNIISREIWKKLKYLRVSFVGLSGTVIVNIWWAQYSTHHT